MIDNNIIQSLGVGSGIDTGNMVRQLTEIERSAPQQRIDTKRELTETKISDYGLMNSALSTLQAAADILVEPEGLFSKTASFTDSDALSPSSLSTEVPAGIYNFEVEQIASAQAMAFAEFASTSAEVGEGTLTFNFGNWTRDVDDLDTDLDTTEPLSFTQDTDHESATITIDAENNSLEGLKDAINDADMGVTASIVHTGTGYKLSILAESGANNELQIVATESGDPGLANFKFDETVPSVETQIGQDALIAINGLQVSRSSNTVDDIVNGLTLDIYKADPGQTMTVTVEDDKEFAAQNIRDFVTAYNTFLEALDPLFGTREVEDEDGNTETAVGSLSTDSLGKSILSRIRTTIASAIPGLVDSDYTSLTNIGIRTELDGSLSINDDDFDDAIENRFEDLQKLLAPSTNSDSSDITVNGFKDSTTSGAYDINVTTAPTKGFLNGGVIDNGTGGQAEFNPTLNTAGKDYTFKISVNGTETEDVVIPAATYADESALADAIELAINSDTNLQAVNTEISVTFDSDNDVFVFTSPQYGTSSTVSITEATTEIADDLGMGVAGGTPGVATAGTINGVAGFGSANVLLPALGEAGEGLAMIIGENATTATVNVSRGFAGELSLLLEQLLESDGLIATRTENLEGDLESLDDDQDSLDRKMTAYEERLINQFISMERIIGGLNSSGSFLENLIDTLPFTAKKD